MVDWTKPIQTVGGSKVRLICNDFKRGDTPFVVAVTFTDDDYETLLYYPRDGVGSTNSSWNIINVPVEDIRYYQIDSSDGEIESNGHKDPEDAAEFHCWHSPKLLKITFVDGIPTNSELIDNL